MFFFHQAGLSAPFFSHFIPSQSPPSLSKEVASHHCHLSLLKWRGGRAKKNGFGAQEVLKISEVRDGAAERGKKEERTQRFCAVSCVWEASDWLSSDWTDTLLNGQIQRGGGNLRGAFTTFTSCHYIFQWPL